MSTDSIFKEYARRAQSDAGVPWVEVGDVGAAMREAATTHGAVYTTDYVAHMQMEPMNCVVVFAECRLRRRSNTA